MSAREAIILKSDFCKFWSGSLGDSFETPKGNRADPNTRDSDSEDFSLHSKEQDYCNKSIKEDNARWCNSVIDKKCELCFPSGFFSFKSKTLIAPGDYLWKE